MISIAKYPSYDKVNILSIIQSSDSPEPVQLWNLCQHGSWILMDGEDDAWQHSAQ